jgi:hypothetical protein
MIAVRMPVHRDISGDVVYDAHMLVVMSSRVLVQYFVVEGNKLKEL